MAHSRNLRASKKRSTAGAGTQSEGPAGHPPTALARTIPKTADAVLARLREDLAQQTTFGFQQLSSELASERRERQRFERMTKLGLMGIGVLLVLATIVVLASIGSAVRDTLAYEMAELTSTTARTIRAGTEPVQATVERQSELMTRAAELERVLVSLYGYEHLAMSGSRQAFVELRRLGARTDDAGLIARNRIGQITARYAILAMPQRGNIRVGDLAVAKGDTSVPLASLASAELVYVLGSPDATLSQVHRVLSLLWDRPIDKALDRELWSLLQRSNNLSASIAVCSLLKSKYGTRATMYDFDAWKSFLAKRI